jgi:hypothetical protein
MWCLLDSTAGALLSSYKQHLRGLSRLPVTKRDGQTHACILHSSTAAQVVWL